MNGARPGTGEHPRTETNFESKQIFSPPQQNAPLDSISRWMSRLVQLHFSPCSACRFFGMPTNLAFSNHRESHAASFLESHCFRFASFVFHSRKSAKSIPNVRGCPARNSQFYSRRQVADCFNRLYPRSFNWRLHTGGFTLDALHWMPFN